MQYPLERFLLQALVVPVEAVAGRGDTVGPRSARRCPRTSPAAPSCCTRAGTASGARNAALDHPYLAEDAARGLVGRGVALVGTDAFNVDSSTAGTTHAHEILLGADVLIVENLTRLEALEPGRPFTCAFVPLRLEGADGSPIRAFAIPGDA